MPFSIEKDINNFPKLIEALTVLDQHEIKAGITEKTGGRRGKKGNATVAEYGTYNEMGTSRNGKEHIKPRSFIRSTADNKRKDWNALTDRLLQSVMDLKQSPETALKKLGTQAKGDIRKTINTLMTPELADSTKKRKKSSKPLIEWGVLFNAIDFEVSKA